MLIEQQSLEKLALLARESRLELEEPTQQIRDMIDCQAAEGELRQFLLSVTEAVEAFLSKSDACSDIQA